jgi:hypothetical protein
MNRLRHAYLEMAPDLEPYFVTSHHDRYPWPAVDRRSFRPDQADHGAGRHPGGCGSDLRGARRVIGWLLMSLVTDREAARMGMRVIRANLSRYVPRFPGPEGHASNDKVRCSPVAASLWVSAVSVYSGTGWRHHGRPTRFFDSPPVRRVNRTPHRRSSRRQDD